MTESKRRMRVLNESYSGFVELYNPFSTLHGTLEIGRPGDEAEVHLTWRDLKHKETWVCVQIQGKQGWLLENETGPRAEE